ncbi:DNA-dependent metalloprotease WSS1 [Daldinia childiae]|uniref:DNA-dependent metalloprotease WSS1 n=1 Tax=Daldinia childiae TaxID=326645 RepID=UPI001444F116|nr:DNA-dependent metalloprotease WSS1 [Daldinia childiae]KAF3069686.1 DNA-dependent metalloprotease WSS1 [Daldinia childiae]
MNEIDPLIFSYSHLRGFPREKDALHTLKKVASLVKPLMRAREWTVGELAEFYPDEHNLLGLNVDSGRQVCLRLRYATDRTQFLPLEQVVDTMLHELAHNDHGPHNSKFHALWNQLRDEHEALLMKGYSGEGFLSAGQRLGGRRIPPEEARRLARVAAENRRTINAGSGQILGGVGPRPGQDIRRVIVDAIDRRSNTLEGCANDNQTRDDIRRIADTATRNGFRTQAEEDAANEAAIAQALWEFVDKEERVQKGDSYIPPSSSRQTWTYGGASDAPRAPPREANRNVDRGAWRVTWTCDICTLENQASFLCCDACGTERDEKTTQDLAQRLSNQQRTVIDLTESSPPRNRNTQPFRPGSGSSSRPTARPAVVSSHSTIPAKSATWTCLFCGRVRERQWWSCDRCGTIKQTS